MLTYAQLKMVLDSYSGISNSCYLGLSSTQPNEKGENFTEPTAEEYARVNIGSNTGYLEDTVIDETNKQVYRKNGKEIHFNEAVSDWGTLGWFGLFKDSTLVYYGHILNQEGSETTIHPTANSIALIRKDSLKIALKADEV